MDCIYIKRSIQRAGEREKEAQVIPSVWKDVSKMFKIKLSIGINLTAIWKYLVILSFLSAFRNKCFNFKKW